PNLGEVQSIYLDPACFRRGLGRSLLAAAEKRLAEMGFQNAILWVFADNLAARRFYEAIGWRAETRTALMELGGRQLTEIRYQKTLR
ncbi:MAG: N-acetyltransferase family protein, partial [Acidimicrobiia bacterium]